MAPSNAPTFSFSSPPTEFSSETVQQFMKLNRSTSRTSCITDTKSCPEISSESRCPSPPSSDSDRTAKTRRKLAWTRSYTDLSGDTMRIPYGQSSKMKRVMMTGNVTAQKRLDMELKKISIEKVKREEEMTLQKLDFIESAFKKSMAMAKGLQRDYEAIERVASRNRGLDLPRLSTARRSLVSPHSSRCNSSVVSAIQHTPQKLQTPENYREEPSSVVKFPVITVMNPITPHSPQRGFVLSQNRRLLKQGESMHDLVEHNMVSTIKHIGNHLAADNLDTPKQPKVPHESPKEAKSSCDDDRFIRLQGTLVPMWKTTSWNDRLQRVKDERVLHGIVTPPKSTKDKKKGLRSSKQDPFGISRDSID